MPGAVHLFLFATSFFTFFLELVSLADLLIQLSSNHFHPWHIWGSFLSLSVSLSLTQIPPQNLTNFSISGIYPSCASSPSSVLKDPLWSRWNMILSRFLLRFSSHFASFIFLYLSLSNYCSLAFLRL